MHQRLAHGDMSCVDGVLKCILSTPTVAQIDKVISIIVKTRYLPNRGIAVEVDGMVSMRTHRKKINDTRIEMVSVTCLVCFQSIRSDPICFMVVIALKVSDQFGDFQQDVRVSKE